MKKTIFYKKALKLLFMLLVCFVQAGCGLIELPFDLLSSAVGTAVSAGVAAAPYAAPFFM